MEPVLTDLKAEDNVLMEEEQEYEEQVKTKPKKQAPKKQAKKKQVVEDEEDDEQSDAQTKEEVVYKKEESEDEMETGLQEESPKAQRQAGKKNGKASTNKVKKQYNDDSESEEDLKDIENRKAGFYREMEQDGDLF